MIDIFYYYYFDPIHVRSLKLRWVNVTVFPTSYGMRAGRLFPSLPAKDVLVSPHRIPTN
jgi:hypothetical protein